LLLIQADAPMNISLGGYFEGGAAVAEALCLLADEVPPLLNKLCGGGRNWA
jgi:hypothetical protein